MSKQSQNPPRIIRAMNGIGPAQYKSPRDYLQARIDAKIRRARRGNAKPADWHGIAARDLDNSTLEIPQ